MFVMHSPFAGGRPETRWRWHLLALGVVLAVFALRVGSISSTYMRDDEEIAFRTTAQDLGYTVWYQAEQDVHAPVWFVSFWLWQQVAGSTEFTARIYSILLSVLTTALMVRLGRSWFGTSRSGIFAVVVFGVNAYAQIYSLEIRPYALGMLLATLNMALFQRWLARATWRRALAYGASVALMLWTHYFLAFLVMAQAVYLVVAGLLPSPPTPQGEAGQPFHKAENGRTLASPVRLDRRRIVQGVGAAGLALLLWLPWLPVFVGQVATLRRIETENGMFRGLGIGNTTEPTTLATIWRFVLLISNGQPLLYALPVVAGLLWARRRGSYALALAWALLVPALNLLVNLLASVYTPRYLSYVAVGVALAVGAGLAALPGRWRWGALALFSLLSLWAMPSQLPTDRTPLRQVFQTVSALAEPGDAVYFIRANDADLFTRWQIDHYLAPTLRANQLDSFAQALETRAVWFITADYFDPDVQARFHELEATHPLQVVAGSCNRAWCYLAQRLLGPPQATSDVFGGELAFYGVDSVEAEADGVTARLWWGAETAPGLDYSISLRLLDAQGTLVAQSDGPLNPGADDAVQTSQIVPGRIYTDLRALAPSAPLTTGEYRLELVVYQSWDNVRLTLPDGSDTLGLRAVTVP
jgi:4-amino-4-deoxy-L-arabinose transferase-like glycosyltransferase